MSKHNNQIQPVTTTSTTSTTSLTHLSTSLLLSHLFPFLTDTDIVTRFIPLRKQYFTLISQALRQHSEDGTYERGMTGVWNITKEKLPPIPPSTIDASPSFSISFSCFSCTSDEDRLVEMKQCEAARYIPRMSAQSKQAKSAVWSLGYLFTRLAVTQPLPFLHVPGVMMQFPSLTDLTLSTIEIDDQTERFSLDCLPHFMLPTSSLRKLTIGMTSTTAQPSECEQLYHKNFLLTSIGACTQLASLTLTEFYISPKESMEINWKPLEALQELAYFKVHLNCEMNNSYDDRACFELLESTTRMKSLYALHLHLPHNMGENKYLSFLAHLKRKSGIRHLHAERLPLTQYILGQLHEILPDLEQLDGMLDESTASNATDLTPWLKFRKLHILHIHHRPAVQTSSRYYSPGTQEVSESTLMNLISNELRDLKAIHWKAWSPSVSESCRNIAALTCGLCEMSFTDVRHRNGGEREYDTLKLLLIAESSFASRLNKLTLTNSTLDEEVLDTLHKFDVLTSLTIERSLPRGLKTQQIYATFNDSQFMPRLKELSVEERGFIAHEQGQDQETNSNSSSTTTMNSINLGPESSSFDLLYNYSTSQRINECQFFGQTLDQRRLYR